LWVRVPRGPLTCLLTCTDAIRAMRGEAATHTTHHLHNREGGLLGPERHDARGASRGPAAAAEVTSRRVHVGVTELVGDFGERYAAGLHPGGDGAAEGAGTGPRQTSLAEHGSDCSEHVADLARLPPLALAASSRTRGQIPRSIPRHRRTASSVDRLNGAAGTTPPAEASTAAPSLQRVVLRGFHAGGQHGPAPMTASVRSRDDEPRLVGEHDGLRPVPAARLG